MNSMDVTKLIKPECLVTLAGIVSRPVIMANEEGRLFVTLASGAVVPINDLLPQRRIDKNV